MGNKLLRQDDNFDGLPPWLAQMRKAVLDGVSQEDIKEIVANQLKKAKEGDPHAIKFVFGQILGGDAFKGATFIQNNYHGKDEPSKPVDAKPGSKDKIDAMRRRVEAGLDLQQPGDAGAET
jgi:hypothetical protein